MITGFNTDIERDGVVYHVQTEDKGLDSPLILSLVYCGGEILAAKRTPYEDLIAAGFNDEALAQRLKRQHRLICAAINAGRIEELRRMSARPEGVARATSGPRMEVEQAPPDPRDSPPDSPSDSPPQEIHDEFVIETAAERTPVTDWAPKVEEPVAKLVAETAPEVPRIAATLPVDPATLRRPAVSAAKKSAYTVYDSRRPSRPGKAPKPEAGLVLTILDDEEFRAGESVNIRVLLQRCLGDDEKPLGGVLVSVKILGTAFRPRIYSVKTQRDGVAVVSVDIPPFTSGRAAVLIRAEAHQQSAELRRVIQPAV